jgi:hypothetical protein
LLIIISKKTGGFLSLLFFDFPPCWLYIFFSQMWQPRDDTRGNAHTVVLLRERKKEGEKEREREKESKRLMSWSVATTTMRERERERERKRKI